MVGSPLSGGRRTIRGHVSVMQQIIEAENHHAEV